ncbi:MAG TPA: RNA-binding protein [Thermoanaerobaculia bacterium]|jgi:RNA recognition motif-containing protein|nr:RNA-binding protein [Thermoanaerobaculia bacterium]
MGRRLFVGNLNFATTGDDLKELFTESGTVESSTVMIDRATGRSRGFGFVEMSTDEEAQKAIEAMNGRSFQGRNLNVNEARERTPGGPPRGGGYGGGGYAGGGGGYGGGGGGGYGGGGGGYGGGGGGYGGGGRDFPPDFPPDFGGGGDFGGGFGGGGGGGGGRGGAGGGRTKPRKEGGSRRGLRAKKRSL